MEMTDDDRKKIIAANNEERKAAIAAGSMKTASERFGYDKVFYDAKRKKELFTGTTKYIEAYNNYIQGIAKKVNKRWNDIMSDPDLVGVPFSEREALANEATKTLYEAEEAIANTLYPGVDKAFAQQTNLNAASNIMLGNLSDPKTMPKSLGPKTEKQIEKFIDKDDAVSKTTTTKKKGRPRKSTAEKKAAAKARAAAKKHEETAKKRAGKKAAK
jgi:hypothetical protein